METLMELLRFNPRLPTEREWVRFYRRGSATPQSLGMEETAIHVKGLEPAALIPGYWKDGLLMPHRIEGLCHLRATFYKSELSGQIDPSQIKGRPSYLWTMRTRWPSLMHWFSADSIGILSPGWPSANHKITCNLSLKKKELKTLASGIINLARRFNQQEGMTRKEDKLPRRFFREVLQGTEKTIQHEDLEFMLKEYYQHWEMALRPLPHIYKMVKFKSGKERACV